MKLAHIVGTLAISLLCHGLALAAPVNINKADAQEISDALSGIGPQKAQAIIDYRKANGPYKSVDDLAAVKGIGSKTVEKIARDVKL